jgi:hypothetical protein
MTTERSVCFTEDEAFDILWELGEALGHATSAGALADEVRLRPLIHLVLRRIDEARGEVS